MGPLALTLGDPAGIGPEIVVKAWRALKDTGPAFFVVGDAQALASAPAGGAPILAIGSPHDAKAAFAGAIPVLDLPLRAPVIAGQPTSAAAPSIIQWIETAVGLALSGTVAGIVTAPIAKAPLYEAGFKFPGHTEFLGELTAAASYDGARGPIMMLTAQDLRVTLVTVHDPLAKVPGKLSIEGVVNAGLVTAQALRRDFGVKKPRIAVSGLNPHAGESGTLGREEIEIIGPRHPGAEGPRRRRQRPLPRRHPVPGRGARHL
jgi:4-hydroxythreonine-4-phosphate dehydrogenase